MNVSLTTELETWITQEVSSGHYSSASEVIREALRNQIRIRQQQHLEQRIAASRQSIAEGNGITATEDYFENKRAQLQ